MRTLDSGRYALTVGVAALMLAGCSGAQSQVGGIGAIPHGSPLGINPDHSNHPKITQLSRIVAQQTQTIDIVGRHFGTNEPYFGDDQHLIIYDINRNFRAGCVHPVRCSVTLNVTSWTDNEIVLGGFGGAYGQRGRYGKLALGHHNKLIIVVFNPQTHKGPAVHAATVK